MATMTMTAPSKQATELRKRRGVWLLLLLLVSALAVVSWWAFHRKTAAEANSNQYNWVAPEIRKITTEVNATGTVKLKTGAEVRVGAQLSGIVRRLNVTVGSHVNQG
jgi:multidrug efflux pump subunit AcrA (membrane-fusion protein)